MKFKNLNFSCRPAAGKPNELEYFPHRPLFQIILVAFGRRLQRLLKERITVVRGTQLRRFRTLFAGQRKFITRLSPSAKAPRMPNVLLRAFRKGIAGAGYETCSKRFYRRCWVTEYWWCQRFSNKNDRSHHPFFVLVDYSSRKRTSTNSVFFRKRAHAPSVPLRRHRAARHLVMHVVRLRGGTGLSAYSRGKNWLNPTPVSTPCRHKNVPSPTILSNNSTIAPPWLHR